MSLMSCCMGMQPPAMQMNAFITMTYEYMRVFGCLHGWNRFGHFILWGLQDHRCELTGLEWDQQSCSTNNYCNKNWSKLSKYNLKSIQSNIKLTRTGLILWLHGNLPKNMWMNITTKIIFCIQNIFSCQTYLTLKQKVAYLKNKVFIFNNTFIGS